MSDQWIVIPNWDATDDEEGLQHYKDRDPIWIKNYRRLLRKDEYRELSFHVRGVLHGLWLEYAASNRQITDNTLTLTRRLGQRVATRDLVSLNHAGFIGFSDSKPLAPCYPRKEKIKSKKGLTNTSKSASEGALFALRTMIANGAIPDHESLYFEVRARGIDDVSAAQLRRDLEKRLGAVA